MNIYGLRNSGVVEFATFLLSRLLPLVVLVFSLFRYD